MSVDCQLPLAPLPLVPFHLNCPPSNSSKLFSLVCPRPDQSSSFSKARSAIRSEEVKSLSLVRLFVTPWTVAYQASLSLEFSKQGYWSGLPFPSPGDLQCIYMEFRKIAIMTLYARQQKRDRCKEQTFGLCGRKQGWDDLRE